jgi:alpha-galactosidase
VTRDPRRRRPSVLLFVLLAGIVASQTARAETNGVALAPPMGWTSWSSLQTEVDENSIKAIAQIQASLLKDTGYVYVNLDGGWYMNPDAGVDAFGRWLPDPVKFPGGMAALGAYIHGLGLKFGIYVTPGIPAVAVAWNTPIESTRYHAADIAIVSKREDTYLGGTMYYIDYNTPGSQEFVNSWANLFASWGVDYLKLDAVGDWNIPDVQAWSKALQQTGRPIVLGLSNNLNRSSAATWRQYANGWRISPDIEAYDGIGLTDWNHVAARFTFASRWLGTGGSGGWNDLDSLAIGGTRTGLTRDERRTMLTLWALSASPLIVGDDLRTLDGFGTDLLTNTEVIGINQSGVVAAPVSIGTTRQVWSALQPDGSYAVGLFNLGSAASVVRVSWADLGITGAAKVRDAFAHADVGTFTGAFSAQLESHASMMLRVTPAAPVQQLLAASGTLTAWAVSGTSPVGTRGQRAQYVGFGSSVSFPRVTVTKGGLYQVTVSYINGDPTARAAVMTTNNSSAWVVFPAAGDWDANSTVQGTTSTVSLSPGTNRIAFWNPFGWAPDLVSITIQPVDFAAPLYSRLVNVASGKVLDDAFGMTAPGIPAIQWSDSGAISQQWQVLSTGDRHYVVVNRLSAQALEPYADISMAGLPLVQRPPAGAASQEWLLVATASGSFILINRATGLLAHGSNEWGGAKVDQWAPVDDGTEQWMIVPVM